jgi:16S rRNA (cytidine1402-2'-O)-methyltransferase
MNDEKAILYIVATPIGNLEDISARALATLRSVDAIICEDTRETSKLLNHYDISKKLFSLHQHSDERQVRKILEEYQGVGRSLAYVSDAGTPGVSDPGGKVVKMATELNFDISPLPGASAVIAALSISGFPTDKFLFLGFMPHKGKGKYFEAIAKSEVTTAFYESTHRILKTLEALSEVLGSEREIVVARELTKMFETIYRGNTATVLEQLKNMSKGEFVVVVSPAK